MNCDRCKESITKKYGGHVKITKFVRNAHNFDDETIWYFHIACFNAIRMTILEELA